MAPHPPKWKAYLHGELNTNGQVSGKAECTKLYLSNIGSGPCRASNGITETDRLPLKSNGRQYATLYRLHSLRCLRGPLHCLFQEYNFLAVADQASSLLCMAVTKLGNVKSWPTRVLRALRWEIPCCTPRECDVPCRVPIPLSSWYKLFHD